MTKLKLVHIETYIHNRLIQFKIKLNFNTRQFYRISILYYINILPIYEHKHIRLLNNVYQVIQKKITI